MIVKKCRGTIALSALNGLAEVNNWMLLSLVPVGLIAYMEGSWGLIFLFQGLCALLLWWANLKYTEEVNPHNKIFREADELRWFYISYQSASIITVISIASIEWLFIFQWQGYLVAAGALFISGILLRCLHLPVSAWARKVRREEGLDRSCPGCGSSKEPIWLN